MSDSEETSSRALNSEFQFNIECKVENFQVNILLHPSSAPQKITILEFWNVTMMVVAYWVGRSFPGSRRTWETKITELLFYSIVVASPAWNVWACFPDRLPWVDTSDPRRREILVPPSLLPLPTNILIILDSLRVKGLQFPCLHLNYKVCQWAWVETNPPTQRPRLPLPSNLPKK
jgi:hypothetical protein